MITKGHCNVIKYCRQPKLSRSSASVDTPCVSKVDKIIVPMAGNKST